ncbi:MAG: hypothetical protein H8E56_03285 [Candidatus Marinimicrobia bacterium]|nr:hypothetical protein [Candidatus Neomarinimicrobiota bacterium]
MDKNKNIDLLVISYDGYSDIWDTFFKSFFHYWKECPLDIHLLSNEKSYNHPQVHPIKVGQDISWSDNLSNGINQLKKDYVLILLEDLFLNQKVSMTYFNQLSNWIIHNNPNYLRLCISHKPEYFDELVGRIPKITPYKTSTMPCIWKRSTLKRILQKGESAWEFEIKGTKRAYEYDGFYAVYNDLISYNNGVIKGKWRNSILKEGNEYGLNINTTSRSVMTPFEEWIYTLRKFRSILFNRLPNGLRLVFKRQ